MYLLVNVSQYRLKHTVNHTKHSVKAGWEFFKAKKWNILQRPSQSFDLNPMEHAFHLLNTRLKAERATNNS